MLVLVVLLFCVLSVVLAGGRLSAVADLRFRGTAPLVAVLAVQILILAVLSDGDPTLLGVVYALTILAAGVFLFVNRHIAGVGLLALGGGLNGVAIVANGGVMPARPGALEAAGRPVVEEGFRNSAAVVDPHLPWLGDWFAIPAGWPLSNVFSVGDAILALGALVLLHVTCGSRLGRLLPSAGDRGATPRTATPA